MIKKILLLISFLVISLTSNAQFINGGGYICSDCYSGLEVGAVSSNISGIENSSAKTGFYIGYYTYYYMSDPLTLRFGVSYSNIGTKIDGFQNPLVLHSINFPLSLHYNFDNKFQVFGGGELGTNAFGKLPTQQGNGDFDIFDFREQFTLFDASVFAGGGIILANNIDINLRYNLGVTNINPNVDGPERKKNWLTLSVGYTWRE